MSYNGRDWDQFTNALTFGYNNTVHGATGLTPSELVFTTPPLNLLLPDAKLDDLTTLRPADAKRKFHERLRSLMSTANKRLQKHQNRYKRNFDKAVKEGKLDIVPGCKVFLRNDVQARPEDDDKVNTDVINYHKLRAKAIGPYEVVGVASHTAKILQDGLLQTVSLDRVIRAPDQLRTTLNEESEEGEQETTEDSSQDAQARPDAGDVNQRDYDKVAEPQQSESEQTSDKDEGDNEDDDADPDSDPEERFIPRRSIRVQARSHQQETDAGDATRPNQDSTEYAFDKLIDYDSELDKYLVRWTKYGPEHDTWQSPSDVPYNAVRSLHQRKRWKIPAYVPNRYID